MKREVCFVAGTRPTWIKLSSVFREMESADAPYFIVNTGQHYDTMMSNIFFEQLGIPRCEYELKVGSGSHAYQTAQIMTGLEPIFASRKPSIVAVFGDTNCVPAAALTAVKLHIPVVHIEAGLRSRDDRMPEEWNRKVGDCLSSLLLATEPDAVSNLLQEGHSKESIRLTGHCLSDVVLKVRPLVLEKFVLSTYSPAMASLEDGLFALATLHRPENVDDRMKLRSTLQNLDSLGIPIVFPVHPRVRHILSPDPWWQSYLFGQSGKMLFIEPLGYLEFLNLLCHCRCVITDSGGVQEEATILGVPCITGRRTTERPSTVAWGSNFVYAGRMDYLEFVEAIRDWVAYLDSNPFCRRMRGPLIELWDGHAAGRMVKEIMMFLNTL